VEERSVSLEDLQTADEVLLTGTTVEVLPVVRVDGKPIGAGQPGPVTQRLYARFTETIGQG
jgi:branched-subunit amino acid aminotransferase/4-amino-4-deoxychorismate lyase